MKYKRYLFISIWVLATQAFAGSFGDGFAQTDLAAYLENASRLDTQKIEISTIPGMMGTNCLVLREKSKVQFKLVPVNEKTKYTLTFRATFKGGEAAEENPRLEMFAANGWTTPILPQRMILFFDANKKKINMQYRDWSSSMPFRNWKEYRDIFYPPQKAAFMQLVLQSGRPEITLGIDKVNFVETPDEGAINCNPVIGKYGKHNYAGWGKPHSGGRMITLDGKVVFDVKYGTGGHSFPLEKPGTYRLTAMARGNGYHSIMSLRFQDAEGKKVEGGTHIRAWGRPSYFVLPPKVKRGCFLTYSNLLEEVRLVWLGDENKIKEFQK